MSNQYARRSPEGLGPYYFRHLDAMTTEKLNEKTEIAAELAWRDREIDRLKTTRLPHAGLMKYLKSRLDMRESESALDWRDALAEAVDEIERLAGCEADVVAKDNDK